MWPGDVIVRALACDSRGHEFNFRPFHCQVTIMGKLFTNMCLSLYNLVSVAGQRCRATGKVTVGLALHWPCVTDLSVLSTYGRKGDEYPTNPLHGYVWYSLPIPCKPGGCFFAIVFRKLRMK